MSELWLQDRIMNYGMPYMGSKNSIAERIIDILPKGRRLVDLFGGGGAISHCAVLSGKYDSVLYNEYDEFVYNGFNKAISRGYKNEKRWISREDFKRLKDKDFYVASCFSFGNNLSVYCYAKEKEPWKKALHYAWVHNDKSLFWEFGIHINPTKQNLKRYNKQLCKAYAKWIKTKEFRTFELQSLESLERLKRLQRIDTSNISYVDYKYKNGDVVYCDPPYEETAEYRGIFDSKAFYDWAISREYPVYFSSYKISDDRFKLIWVKKKRGLLSGSANNLALECLYWNGR